MKTTRNAEPLPYSTPDMWIQDGHTKTNAKWLAEQVRRRLDISRKMPTADMARDFALEVAADAAVKHGIRNDS